MNISSDIIKHIAGLSRLSVDDVNVVLYAKQLSSILNYVYIIEKLELTQDGESIGLSFVDNLNVNETRADIVVQESKDDLLSFIESASGRSENFFRSPKAL